MVIIITNVATERRRNYIDKVDDINNLRRGLTTPRKYFCNKTREEIREILEKKFGPPNSTRPYGDTYYNPRTQHSFNVHQEPGHLEGKPHVDIRRRGNFPERKYLLKEID
jgi:hypothetical protein